MGRLYEYDLRERRENMKPVHKKPKMSEGKAKHVMANVEEIEVTRH